MDNLNIALKEIISFIEHDKLIFEYGKLSKKFSILKFQDMWKIDLNFKFHNIKDKEIHTSLIGLGKWNEYKIIKIVINYYNEPILFPYYIVKDELNKISLEKHNKFLTDHTLKIHNIIVNG